MKKSQMKLANRAWRKATKNWGGWLEKTRRDCCRSWAEITVEAAIDNKEAFITQYDADDAVAEELTYWN